MTNEKVDPTIKDGIEFYVSLDGKQCGMSHHGLARLCGVASSTLREYIGGRLKTYETAKTPSMGGNNPGVEYPYFENLEGTNGVKTYE